MILAKAIFLFLVLQLTASKVALADCLSPAGVAGQMQWFSANADVEFCNGTYWVSMLTAATANSCSIAGQFTYVPGSQDAQFCNGTVWNSMSSAASSGACAGVPAGSLRYNGTTTSEEWCDGTIWHTMVAQPTLNLSFAAGQLPLPVRFNRASGSGVVAGTYYNSAGTLVSAPANLFQQSQTFSSPWGTSYQAVTANVALAPDGTTTAAKVVDSSGGSTPVHYLSQGLSLSTGTNYCGSAYVKAGERTVVRLASGGNFSPFFYVDLNLSTGVIQGHSGATNYGVTALGNGWYRLFGCGPHTGTNGTTGGIIFQTFVSGSANFTGDDTSGYYLWGAQFEIGASPTSYTYTTTAAAYGPRFDYDPSTLQYRGLLIEAQRTNLLYPSAYQAYSNSGISLVSSSTVAPDLTNAFKLTESTSSSTHLYGNTVTISANTYYSYSVYLKAGERTQAIVYAGKSGSPYTRGGMLVDLSAGTFTNNDAGTPSSVVNRTMSSVGNGWYRIGMTVIIDSSSTDGYMEVRLYNGSTVSYAGDGTSGLYMWGGQIENGYSVSSYIPTTTASTTRSSDSVSVPNISWYTPQAGTFFTSFILPAHEEAGIYNWIFAMDDTTSNNRFGMFVATSNSFFTIARNGGTQYQPGTNAAASTGGLSTAAGSYGNSRLSASLLGNANMTYSSATIPAVSRLVLGYGDNYLFGWLRNFAYYPLTMTDSQVKQMSVSGLP